MVDSTKPAGGGVVGVPSSERLDSWKEIAAYLGRTERTARRWEKTEDLPVCRHPHAKRDTVYAFKSDLDVWLCSRRTRSDNEGSPVIQKAGHNRLAWLGASFGVLVIAVLAVWRDGRTDITMPGPFKIVPLTSYPGYERYPSFSPDGTQVAFSWRDHNRGRFHIYTKSIGGGAPVKRTEHDADDLSPCWSPDGRSIAFLRSMPDNETSEIMLIPASGGPERRLTTILRFDSAPSSLILFGRDVAWSPDSRSLVVSGRGSPGQRFGLFLVSIDTGARRTLLSSAPGSVPYLAPSISPDARHLAFVRRTDFTVSEIWVTKLRGDFTPEGEPRRVTYGNRLTTSPTWANGDEILFLSGELGAEAYLYRLSIREDRTPTVLPSLGDGAALLTILQPSATPLAPPARLAYTRVMKDHNIWRLESRGRSAIFGPSRPFMSSTRIDFNPQFSPDGTKVAFESTRSGTMEIWIADHDGSNPVPLTHFGGPLTGAARWSPDSQQIVFNSRLRGQADVYVVSVNGGKPRQLTSDSSNEDLASWSTDGRWVYFHSDRNGSSQVWRIPATGGAPIQVTHTGGLAALESTDGRFVYYSKGKALGPASLWRVSKDGASGDETRVLESLADWSTFYVVAEGVYFIPYAQPDGKTSISFHTFADGTSRILADIDKPISVGLAVSRDGRVILYTQVDRDDNDLMLAYVQQ